MDFSNHSEAQSYWEYNSNYSPKLEDEFVFFSLQISNSSLSVFTILLFITKGVPKGLFIPNF